MSPLFYAVGASEITIQLLFRTQLALQNYNFFLIYANLCGIFWKIIRIISGKTDESLLDKP